MASIEFPLLQKQTPFGRISDPRIPVRIHTLAGETTFLFLVDTGADFSLAPRRLAAQIGLDWQSLPAAAVRGVGQGEAQARLGLLPMESGGIDVSVRCLFADMPGALFILGRADFLDRFAVSIDGGKGLIALSELV